MPKNESANIVYRCNTDVYIIDTIALNITVI